MASKKASESVGNVDAVICIAGEAEFEAFDSKTEEDFYVGLNRHKRAHSPQLAAGLASESKIGKIPYREDPLQLASGNFSIKS
jgi:hypothetical protein